MRTLRTLAAALAAVVIGATGFTAYTMATAPAAGHVTPIDPTMSDPVWRTAPAGYPDCSQWKEIYGVITFRGARTLTYGGCVNPLSPGKGDSFTGYIDGYLAAAKG